MPLPRRQVPRPWRRHAAQARLPRRLLRERLAAAAKRNPFRFLVKQALNTQEFIAGSEYKRSSVLRAVFELLKKRNRLTSEARYADDSFQLAVAKGKDSQPADWRRISWKTFSSSATATHKRTVIPGLSAFYNDLSNRVRDALNNLAQAGIVEFADRSPSGGKNFILLKKTK